MAKRNITGIRSVDWVAFSLYLALLVIGWLMIFAVGYDDKNVDNLLRDYVFKLDSPIGRQTIWLSISVLIFFITFLIDSRFWRTFSYPIYVFAVILLISVLVFGTEIKGARSWFTFGGFSFQPAELAKFGTSLAIAAFLSSYSTDLRITRHQLISVGLFLVPAVLTLIQPDAGSALILLSFLFVLYRAGLSPFIYLVIIYISALFIFTIIIDAPTVFLTLMIIAIGVLMYNLKVRNGGYLALAFLGLLAGAALGYIYDFRMPVLLATGAILIGVSVFYWKKRGSSLLGMVLPLVLFGGAFTFLSNYGFEKVLKPHQQDRINVWLRPDRCDPEGSLYNVLQSKMAIGSGGLEGKGFLEGTMTKLNYVPEQATDFIFCTIGEEHGFVGTFLVILLYFLLLIRLIMIGERQKNDFAKIYAYCVASLLFFHVTINIGMTMGLFPIIGIPLPFVSYGGSSLMGFTLMLGVLLKMDSERHASL